MQQYLWYFFIIIYDKSAYSGKRSFISQFCMKSGLYLIIKPSAAVISYISIVDIIYIFGLAVIESI